MQVITQINIFLYWFQANIVEQSTTSTMIRPVVYLKAAKAACEMNVDNIKAKYPNLEDRNMPFLCMDLVYLYTLLVDGFGIYVHKKLNQSRY